MSLKHEPASEPLHNSVKWLFLNRKLQSKTPPRYLGLVRPKL